MLVAATVLSVFTAFVAAQNLTNGTTSDGVGGPAPNDTAAGDAGEGQGNNTVAVSSLILHSFLNETMALEEFPKANATDFNRVSIAGWRSKELTRAAASFNNYTTEQREAIVDDFHAHNKVLRVSAFGANDNVTTDRNDPEQIAERLANYSNSYGLDGVDINYEDRAAVASGEALDWLNKFHAKLNTTLKNHNPAALITYSPIADFFAHENDTWVQFLKGVQADVAWINIQFYNGGRFNYTTSDQLFGTTGNESFPSRAQIAANLGVDVGKIVVQKPLQENQPGYVAAVDLGKAFCERNVTFNGVSVWRIDYRNLSISNGYLQALQNATAACGVQPNGTEGGAGSVTASPSNRCARRTVPTITAAMLLTTGMALLL